MTDLEAFTAAYMAACKGRAADHNMIGHWYFRQAWQAAIKQERERDAAGLTPLYSTRQNSKRYQFLRETSLDSRALKWRAFGTPQEIDESIDAAIRARSPSTPVQGEST